MQQICPWLKKGKCRFGTRCHHPHGKVDFPCPFSTSCNFSSIGKCWYKHSHQHSTIPPKAELKDFICAEVKKVVEKKMKSKYIPKDVNLEKENLTNRDLVRLAKELKRENAELKNQLHETQREIKRIGEESIRYIQLHEKKVGEMFREEKEKLEVLSSNITGEIKERFRISILQNSHCSNYVVEEIAKVHTHMDKLHDRICANEDKLKGKRIPRKAKAKSVSAIKENDTSHEPRIVFFNLDSSRLDHMGASAYRAHENGEGPFEAEGFEVEALKLVHYSTPFELKPEMLEELLNKYFLKNKEFWQSGRNGET